MDSSTSFFCTFFAVAFDALINEASETSGLSLIMKGVASERTPLIHETDSFWREPSGPFGLFLFWNTFRIGDGRLEKTINISMGARGGSEREGTAALGIAFMGALWSLEEFGN